MELTHTQEECSIRLNSREIYPAIQALTVQYLVTSLFVHFFDFTSVESDHKSNCMDCCGHNRCVGFGKDMAGSKSRSDRVEERVSCYFVGARFGFVPSSY